MRVWILLVSASTVAFGAPAIAQEARPVKEAPADQAIEDIIVTAQRVETSEQKTPISMKVYGEETLRDRGVRDYRALQNIDSSLQIPSAGSGLPTLTIRGVTSTNVSQT